MLQNVEKTSYASKYREEQLCFYMLRRRTAMPLYVEKASYASICRGEDQLCIYIWRRRPAMLFYVEKISYASIYREEQLCFYM